MRAIIAAVALLAACGYPEPDPVGGGDAPRGDAAPADAPAGVSFHYGDAAPVYARGYSAMNAPSDIVGNSYGFSIDPPLPAGLSLNPNSGRISGTPSGYAARAAYTVHATINEQPAIATVTITVLDVRAIAAGADNACALVNDGVQCWRGTGSVTFTQVIPSGSNVTSLAMGGNHACAVVNGSAQCWGDNQFGDLGNNSTTASATPVPVTGLGSNVSIVGLGEFWSCAIVNGGASCWGGQTALGNGSNESHIPVQVTGLTTGVQTIGGGVWMTCVAVGGAAKCWGSGPNGELGNGSSGSSATPVQVSGLTSGVSAVVAGGFHVCAIVNGAVKCWGAGQHGALGNNSTASSTSPVAVSGIPSGAFGATALALTYDVSCAVVNHMLQCWGDGSKGQLGNGGMSEIPTPTYADLPGDVTAVAANGEHVCAISDGHVSCWGDNVLTPTRVDGL